MKIKFLSENVDQLIFGMKLLQTDPSRRKQYQEAESELSLLVAHATTQF